eukprot:764583-Hanusia_phi.AAC.2
MPIGSYTEGWERDIWMSLTRLSLEGNSLVELPVEIELLSLLLTLDLQYNFLSMLPPGIGGMTKLEVATPAQTQLYPADSRPGAGRGEQSVAGSTGSDEEERDAARAAAGEQSIHSNPRGLCDHVGAGEVMRILGGRGTPSTP